MFSLSYMCNPKLAKTYANNTWLIWQKFLSNQLIQLHLTISFDETTSANVPLRSLWTTFGTEKRWNTLLSQKNSEAEPLSSLLLPEFLPFKQVHRRGYISYCALCLCRESQEDLTEDSSLLSVESGHKRGLKMGLGVSDLFDIDRFRLHILFSAILFRFWFDILVDLFVRRPKFM